ncbi:YihY/virulence factor BrkB family protein [Sediminibacter sp. Hel_I_10]|uniref:YihY/virulence factor BrkB family protein n=1 Tax=Sediminibacter sp. Hel_I_10 TaxID=1392490 RepID=UPI00047BE33C|nr:YihY/virulence factor BrkB family protein [Sediminibacter sp. Hel_I_10]
MDSPTFKLQHLPKLLVKTGKIWFNDEPFRLSAIVAYYAILSLPALIIIILNVVGSIWGRDIVQGELLGEISSALGPETADSIRMMIVDQGSKSTSVFATIVGIGTLIYGATGVFFQLQSTFDQIWKAEEKYSNGIVATLMSRLKSFGFILILGFLLLVSFILTSLLSTFSRRLKDLLPEYLFQFIYIFDIVLSLGFIYVLFAAMFKFLPSKSIRWRAVRIGAAITAILFMIGKYLLAIYFSEMQPGSTYGAAGSIILIMLWVSYSSLILFYGAHFTKVYSDTYLITEDTEDSSA